MELGVRDWMIIIGVLLIAVVLIDGFRRIRNERRNHIRVCLNKQFTDMGTESDEEYSSELPSGGARVVGREDDDFPLVQSVSELQDGEFEPDPLFVEPKETFDSFVEPSLDTAPIVEDDKSEASVAPPPAPRIDPSEQEMIVVNVMARNEPFKGSDLLQILLACDCRFGDMNIFHRYEDSSGQGPVQFSIVNIVEPGVFNLDNISEFTTPGVTFFMAVPGPDDVMQAFNCMVETAQCLVKNLNGELLDESRSVMTSQTLEHCRQKIRDFERKQLTQHS